MLSSVVGELFINYGMTLFQAADSVE